MKYGNITGIDKPVSRLVQGTTMISRNRREESFALLDGIFALGGNAFDTAKVYNSEGILGDWIHERGLRNQVVILAKGAHHDENRRRVTPEDITEDLMDSLERLRVETIDLYVLHRDDETVPVGLIVDVLTEHARAGRISAFGGSNWTHERLRAANDHAREHGQIPFAVSSPNYTLAVQIEEPWENCVSLSGPSGAEARAWYAASGMAVIPWSSLASGFFSGRFTREDHREQRGYWQELCSRCYCSEENFQRLDRVSELARDKDVSIAQIALAAILGQPMNLFPLVGSSTPQEFADNARALDIDLTEQEMAYLDLRADTPR